MASRKRGRHGSHGEGQQGLARTGNAREGDHLKTTKETMPMESGIQAQADIEVAIAAVENASVDLQEPAYYPKGLA